MSKCFLYSLLVATLCFLIVGIAGCDRDTNMVSFGKPDVVTDLRPIGDRWIEIDGNAVNIDMVECFLMDGASGLYKMVIPSCSLCYHISEEDYEYILEEFFDAD